MALALSGQDLQERSWSDDLECAQARIIAYGQEVVVSRDQVVRQRTKRQGEHDLVFGIADLKR